MTKILAEKKKKTRVALEKPYEFLSAGHTVSDRQRQYFPALLPRDRLLTA